MITQYVRLVACTGRWTFIGYDALDDQLARAGPVLFIFWHGQFFIVPVALPRRGSRIATVTSAHEDGRLAASIAGRFGIGSVRLSSRGGNTAGHRAILAAFRERMSLCIAGDGSRGPVYRLRPGILQIARLYQGRVALVAYACERYLQCGSWDRFRLPLPFTRGVFMCRCITDFPESTDPAVMEAYRQKLERELMQLALRVDALMR